MGHPSLLQGTRTYTSLLWLQLNKCLLKLIFMLCGFTLVICAFYLRRNSITDNRNGLNWHTATTTNQSGSSISIKKENQSARRPGKKIFIANYWEQLTMATNNFLDLTALAAYGERQVVLPFVKDSTFRGVPSKEASETLALYYNVSALNHSLGLRGHGTLISWKEFQDLCQGKLDILVHLDYQNPTGSERFNRSKRGFSACKVPKSNALGDLKVERTICMNVLDVDSVEKFENDVIKRLPCVGLDQWRGSSTTKRSKRAKFDLSAVVPHRLRAHDVSTFFSSSLLQVARDFIAKRLGPFFVSAHIRAEKIMLKVRTTFNNSVAVKKCISNLTAQIQSYKNASRAPIPLFLATDFGDYGSRGARLARENAKSLMNILAPLKPIIFQPSTYNLTDRGAVAIAEMNILTSGKRLFVVGGGSFQGWQTFIFLNKKSLNSDQEFKCRNKLCNRLCCL